jgi:hypothetical protein
MAVDGLVMTTGSIKLKAADLENGSPKIGVM